MNSLALAGNNEAAARFVRSIISWFPHAEPDADWIKQAHAAAKRWPEATLAEAHRVLMRQKLRRLPSVPVIDDALLQAADTMTDKALVRDATIPMEGPAIAAQAWDALARFIASNRPELTRLVVEGWGALALTDLTRLARRHVQAPELVPMAIPESVLKIASTGPGPGVKPHTFDRGLIPQEIRDFFSKGVNFDA